MNVFPVVIDGFLDLVQFDRQFAKCIDHICPVGIPFISQKKNVPGFGIVLCNLIYFADGA